MKYPNIISLACVSGLAAAQIWAAPGGGGWGWGPGWAGPQCANSCVSSAFAPEPTAWSNHCATPAALSSCVSTACSEPVPASSIWSLQSSLCSSWSPSCTSSSCTGWPAGWSGWGGWGGPGGNGWYTVTATETGLTTRTVVVTTTVSGTVIETSTVTQTATRVIAGAAVAAGTATATPTGSSSAGAVTAPNSFMALIAAAMGAVAFV